ncbi:PREDICTED: zinc finger with UFM1-specific peptidase domain protein [Tarenaya hassleriana]|uniref:zinc finger with UFM1-specific peptidase domain protein n=1 Tax=Tarenaya hassleriana TaxID=28532 RepID=UPI00053C3EED|nr:PREDICTED: zinc finger with UFM1-specific peptidase domain protein [Tarenaya hassleriana]
MSASCPVCNLTLPLSEIQSHANAHFESDEDGVQDFCDEQLALQLASSDPSPSSATFDDSMDLDGKVACLVSSQTKSTFYRVRQDGLICLLKNCLESELRSKPKPQEGAACLLSGYVDHFQCNPSEDLGWGCGWRNIQMQCSHLLSHREEVRPLLFGASGFVPDIPSLQLWLEMAWSKGFDLAGSLHFGNRIYGSKKWIGTTECAALLRSFGLKARIVDFAPKKSESLHLSVPGSALAGKRKPCGPMDRYVIMKQESHPENSVKRCGSNPSRISREETLMDWVWNYFSDNSWNMSSGVRLTSKSPLYFQHDGHSRTIIGIQKCWRGLSHQYNLLILDPADRTEALETSLVEKKGWEKYFKRGAHTLKQPEYQLLYVDDGIANGEELEQLKIIDSLFVEF